MLVDIKKVKIFVTTPPENTESIRNAVCSLGAGVIGNYTFCTTSTTSTGTFLPNENANPHIGKINNLEFVQEDKLEFVCDIELVPVILSALRKAHPYEEPAIDIVPLLDESSFY